MSEEKDSKPEKTEKTEKTEKKSDLAAELEKSKSDYLYLLAEFDNYRKKAIKERSELMKYGSERMVTEFLNILDNFERALEAEIKEENVGSFREGVKMIAGEIQSLLQRHGVEELKVEGLPFDPAQHEAISSEPREDIPAGHVSRVFKKGYKMHDKLIRPAQVVVASAIEKKEN